MTARPVYLGAAAGFFGLFHAAVGDPSGVAVVLCPAFGWEGTAAYRPLRAWAEHLAAAGHRALRIDLPGTGDSPGGPRDPGTFDAWQSAVTDAASTVRAEPGVRRVVVVGIGMGGLLALSALRDGAAIDDVVAWATPARGRTLVRELEAFAAFESSVLPRDGPYAPGPSPPGSIAVAGYHLDASTAAALSKIDLTDWEPSALTGRRVLLLGRSGIKVDERLHRALVSAGAEVDVADGAEFSQMTAEPQVASPPAAAFRAVAAWLADAPASPLPAPPAVSLREELELVSDGAPVRERPMRLGVLGGDLFGVFAEPADAGPADVCLVLLNAGALNHAGPNRLWVEIARRWAARGVPSLRVDLAGIGESDGDASTFRDVASFYVPELVDQVPEMLDRLDELVPARRYMVIGLCSGAYWGFHAATRDPRIVAVLMVNPRSLVWDPRVETMRDARRLDRLMRRSTWRKLRHRGLGAFTSPRVVAGAMFRQVLDAPRQARAARRAQDGGDDELDRLFGSLRDRQTRALLVFSGDEPLYEELEAEGRLARWPTLGVQLMARSPETHTLRPMWLQRRLHEIVDEEVEGVLAARARDEPAEGRST